MSLSSIRNFFPSTGIVNSIITQMHERVALAFSQRPETTSPENRQYDYYPIVFIWASGLLSLTKEDKSIVIQALEQSLAICLKENIEGSEEIAAQFGSYFVNGNTHGSDLDTSGLTGIVLTAMETEAFNNKRVALGLKPITRYYREQTMSFPIQSQQTGGTTIIEIYLVVVLDQ
ncbi:hypothetical protein PGT21_001687 [Puccinia graminis f. sp. tritici]|uniref:Uncharacterized protein n=1 Tax=Puccinia graminis f. sp. tritici TaxID=56615 RepID=A0A5B0R067_PUCGR|nr:hypothetical protein PGT21_001687 [Puccinia graminis f. sp. tritici]